MGFAQIAIFMVSILVLLYAANQHGKPRNGKVNFWIVLTAVCINIATLAFGGFFSGAFNFHL